MDADEILDGLALWDEHKPQGAEDWMAVAQRCVAAGHDESVSEPVFAALVKTTRDLAALQEAAREAALSLRVLITAMRSSSAEDDYEAKEVLSECDASLAVLRSLLPEGKAGAGGSLT